MGILMETEKNQLEADAADTGVVREAAESGLTEDVALGLLKRGELTTAEIEQITKDAAVMKSRKVRLRVTAHPRTPRRISLRLLRELCTFDLMHFAMIPTAPADLKRVADELLVGRLPSITLGERISLARRGSGTIAAALLLAKESRVWQTALENGRITESAIVRAVLHSQATPAFVQAVCTHTKWSVRPEIRVALLRSAHTPLGRALEFARRLPPTQLRDVLHASRLPQNVKETVKRELNLAG